MTKISMNKTAPEQQQAQATYKRRRPTSTRASTSSLSCCRSYGTSFSLKTTSLLIALILLTQFEQPLSYLVNGLSTPQLVTKSSIKSKTKIQSPHAALRELVPLTPMKRKPSKQQQSTTKPPNGNDKEGTADEVQPVLVEAGVRRTVKKLVQSKGPEILNEKHQESLNDNTVLEFKDASQLEKIAMATIKTQLPSDTVKQLHSENARYSVSSSGGVTSNNKQQQFRHRELLLDHEKELELARTIQAGVKLQAIRVELEEKKIVKRNKNWRKRHRKKLKEHSSMSVLMNDDYSNELLGEIDFDDSFQDEMMMDDHLLDEDDDEMELMARVDAFAAGPPTTAMSASRTEWAAAAGLTTKELRRAIIQYRQAKHDLVSANMGLVHTVVRTKYSNRLKEEHGISYDELIQEGSLGLLRAAELFDPERGLRFSTYAVVWIKGVLSNTHVVEAIKLPQREKTRRNKLTKLTRELTLLNGGTPPTIPELADAAGMRVADVIDSQTRMRQVSKLTSLDQTIVTRKQRSGSGEGGNDLTMGDDILSSHEDAELQIQTEFRADLIAAMTNNLELREARLLRLRYGLNDEQPRTLQQCADAMGLSYGRVHQLMKKCITKLQTAKEASSLEEYLQNIT